MMGAAGDQLRMFPSGPGPVEDVFHEFLQDGDVELVADAVAVAVGTDEVGVAQHREVARHGGPAARKPLRDFAGRERSLAEHLDDGAPRGIGEGAEDGVVAGHGAWWKGPDLLLLLA